MTPEDIKKSAAQAASVPLMTLIDLEVVVERHVLMADPHVLKVLVATVIANKLSGNPVWLFLVGASSSGKTMFLDMLTGMQEIYPLSNLTPNTFVSGQANQRGLLFEIDKKILTFKDFTTIIALHQEARNEIMSQLREIYDGSYKKAYGTGATRDWTGKIGFLAGVTSHIDLMSQLYASLGERFVQYRLITPDRKAVGMRGVTNSSRNEEAQENARNDMRAAFQGCIRKIEQGIDLTAVHELSHEQKKRLVDMADFATLARSPVLRDMGSSKEIYFKPTSEMPVRFAQQLNQIAMGLMYVNKAAGDEATVTLEDEKILYKIALDSISMTRRSVIQKLAEFGSTTTAVIATATSYPTGTTRRMLEDLNVLGIIDRTKDKKSDIWTLKPEFESLVITYDGITKLTDEEKALIENEASKVESDDTDFMNA